MQPGTLTINLYRRLGNVTTTAANIVSYFNTNSAVLSNLGISVSNAPNTDGTASTGAGLVAASTATGGEAFTNNATVTPAYAAATTTAANGTAAQLTFTARNEGAAYNGIKVKIVNSGAVTVAGDETFAYSAIEQHDYRGHCQRQHGQFDRLGLCRLVIDQLLQGVVQRRRDGYGNRYGDDQ